MKKNIVFVALIALASFIAIITVNNVPAEPLNVHTQAVKNGSADKNHQVKNKRSSIKANNKRNSVSNKVEPNVFDAKSLIEALNNLKSGDQLILAPGEYELKETVSLINLDNVRIIGYGASIIQEGSSIDVMEIKSCTNIFLEGIHLTHKKMDHNRCIGRVLVVQNSDGLTAQTVKLNGCGSVGLFANSSNNISIDNSRIFQNSSIAMSLRNCNLSVTNSNIYENNDNSIIFNEKHFTEDTDQKVKGYRIFLQNNTFFVPQAE